MPSEVIPLFSSPVYVSNDGKMPEVTDVITDMDIADEPYNNTGNVTSDKHALRQLPQLQAWVMGHVDEYVYGVQGIDPKKHTAEITNSWINFMFKGDSAHGHDHCNSQFSGVCYLYSPEGSGNIIFHQSKYKALEPHLQHPNLYNASEYAITPETGMIVIFPSDVIHSVTPCNISVAKESRISLAFNVICRGDYGIQTKLLTI